ncbi:MAG: radical SAM protein [Thermoanaerobaculia bacterium]
MPGPLVVLPAEPRKAIPRRLPARGTKVAEIQSRQVRLNPPGEKPWVGREDDHRDRINVEKHGDAYVVYRPSIGALSALAERDYLPFHVFTASNGDRAALARFFVQMGKTEQQAQVRAERLAARLERDGWTRTEFPSADSRPLMTAYLTVTRYCDLGCPYCYQGLNDRVGTDMSLEQVRLVLERIAAVNPGCQVNVTGGEPFTHSGIHEILDMIVEFGFPFIVLSNGTYIDERAASHLKALPGFRYIQISLDGFSPETHEMTRGKGHFPKALAGIHNVIAQKLPFKLAPTLHNANMHELPQIGELALANGGWVSPNQLKELPHSGLDYTNLAMSNEQMMVALRQLNDHIVDKFGLAYVAEVGRRYVGSDPEVCSVAQPNSTFICGMAHSLMDIDWNGDVYPCHLSKGPDLKIGNIFEEDFDRIFQRVEDRGIRVKSHEIEKCSGCKFVSTCAGGCRAGAWFTYGTLEHEDELCNISYPSQLRRLLVGAGVS